MASGRQSGRFPCKKGALTAAKKNAAFGLNPKTEVGRFLAKPRRVELRFLCLPARLRVAQEATSAKLIQAVERYCPAGRERLCLCSKPVEGVEPAEWRWDCCRCMASAYESAGASWLK